MNERKTLIKVENLVVEYGKGAKRHRAVDGISFTIHAGECVGFVGANGAGKSTTIKSLMGFLFPASGTVEVFGLQPVWRKAACGPATSRKSPSTTRS